MKEQTTTIKEKEGLVKEREKNNNNWKESYEKEKINMKKEEKMIRITII